MILFLLPITVASLGAGEHMERSKQTDFCLSCHIMAPYGKSLHIDDPAYLPAAHYQNARVPRDEAYYTWHTDYVMYGGILGQDSWIKARLCAVPGPCRAASAPLHSIQQSGVPALPRRGAVVRRGCRTQRGSRCDGIDQS